MKLYVINFEDAVLVLNMMQMNWHTPLVFAQLHPAKIASSPRGHPFAKAGRSTMSIAKDQWRKRASNNVSQTSDIASSLKELARLLRLDMEDEAVSLAIELRDSGVLRAFGKAHQVPKRAYTIEELRLNKIDTSKFLAPTDTTLNRVRSGLQLSYLIGASFAAVGHWLDLSQIVQSTVLMAALLVADQIGNSGGMEALMVDSAGRIFDRNYAARVALHEAGHFLTAYLIGILPRDYAISSWDAFVREKVLNVQAGTRLCDKAFQREVLTGRLSSSTLDLYSCVALAGVATEWLRYGQAEGGLEDVRALDSLLQALKFSQAKADAQVRWAVLNVVSLLRRHSSVQDAVADAMLARKPVVEIVELIELKLSDVSDV